MCWNEHPSLVKLVTDQCCPCFPAIDLAKVFEPPGVCCSLIPHFSCQRSTLICIHVRSNNSHACGLKAYVFRQRFIIVSTQIQNLFIKHESILVLCTWNFHTHIYIYTYIYDGCQTTNEIRPTGSAVGLADHTACRPRESKPG